MLNVKDSPLTTDASPETEPALLRVCVVDSFLSESVPDAVPTQGALLANCLAREGVKVIATSSKRRKLMRAIDMAVTLIQRSADYDVVLIQVFGRRGFAYAQLSSWIVKRLGKRIVLTLRGGTLPTEWREHPMNLSRVLDRADALVAPSSYMAGVFRDAGYSLEIIPNFIELERYRFCLRTVSQPRLFWMRAFHHQYNPQMAIEALSLLQTQFPQAVLSMGGPDRGELLPCRQLAKKLGVANKVRFLGFLTKEQILAEAPRHDIHLHTNRIDNTPVTLIENMALGLPIVATRVGGVPHLVKDGKTGILVESEDAQSMAAAVTRLLTDTKLTAALSLAGRDFVEQNCSWRAVKDSWRSLILRVQ